MRSDKRSKKNKTQRAKNKNWNDFKYLQMISWHINFQDHLFVSFSMYVFLVTYRIVTLALCLSRMRSRLHLANYMKTWKTFQYINFSWLTTNKFMNRVTRAHTERGNREIEKTNVTNKFQSKSWISFFPLLRAVVLAGSNEISKTKWTTAFKSGLSSN